mmetsp:Transcript_4028/g.13455  ORF Transcript_4028/g.13455 Transcript_4028/m.13455 type:complete len:95 (-) Transcript_4028:260-544(-)
MSKKGDLEVFGGQRDRGNVVIELQHCTSSANFLIQRISGYLTKIFGFDTDRVAVARRRERAIERELLGHAQRPAPRREQRFDRDCTATAAAEVI